MNEKSADLTSVDFFCLFSEKSENKSSAFPRLLRTVSQYGFFPFWNESCIQN